MSLSGMEVNSLDLSAPIINKKRGPFSENPSWNDFLNGIAKAYPLRHPKNTDGKEKLRIRIANTKDRINKKLTTNNPPLNVYSQVTSFYLKGGGEKKEI